MKILLSWLGLLPKNKEACQLEKVNSVIDKSTRGIYKRLDENRELLQLLQVEASFFLKTHPWVTGWIQSNDQFFSDLAEASEIEKRIPRLNRVREWPEPKPLNLGNAIPAEPISTYASFVYSFTNKDYFATMLAAFEDEATRLNLKFYRGFFNYEITVTDKHNLGSAVLTARFRHLFPWEAEDETNKAVTTALNAGAGSMWVEQILAALKAQGLSLAPIIKPD